MLTTDDGIDMRNIPLGILLGVAFGMSNDRIIGGPPWLNGRYDINAKMDAPVADALKKLNPLDRRAARQHMMQAVLIERCKIAFHRDTKELPVFLMVVAKRRLKAAGRKAGRTLVRRELAAARARCNLGKAD